MTDKIPPEALSAVSEMMLATLYTHALESRRPDALIHDPRAEELVARIDYDFERLQINANDQVVPCLRLTQLDRVVQTFLAAHPDGVVAHIGCGLDTRFERVCSALPDNQQIMWYDLDLPPVIDLRRKLIDETPRYKMLAASALDLTWLDTVDAHPGKPFLFIAEGVLMYFPEAEVRRLVLALRERFPGTELAFDATWPLTMWLYNLGFYLKGLDARLCWSLRHYDTLEAWAPGIRLLEMWDLTSFKKFITTRRKELLALLRLFPALGQMGATLHYRLDQSLTQRETKTMKNKSKIWGYIMAALVGAMAGGIAVALASRLLPTLMAQMMEKMMARMKAEGRDPTEMCQRMMARMQAEGHDPMEMCQQMMAECCAQDSDT